MAYEELKQKQSAMWGNGPYQRITETLTDIHDLVIERLAPESGDRWLDLACGTGAISERAAAAGASVTGIDLAPALIETAKERAEELRARDRLPGRRLRKRSTSPTRASTRSRPRSGDVRAGPRGSRAASSRASPRPAAGSRSPTGRRRAASGGCSSSWPRSSRPRRRAVRSTGATRARCATYSATRSSSRSRSASRRCSASGEDYWELFSTSYGPTKTLADSLGDRREDYTATGSSSSRRTTSRTARSCTRASTCSCWGPAASAYTAESRISACSLSGGVP